MMSSILRALVSMLCFCNYSNFSLAMPLTACSFEEMIEIRDRQEIAKQKASYGRVSKIYDKRVLIDGGSILAVIERNSRTTAARDAYRKYSLKTTFGKIVEVFDITGGKPSGDVEHEKWAIYLDYLDMEKAVREYRENGLPFRSVQFTAENGTVDIKYTIKDTGPLHKRIQRYFRNQGLGPRSSVTLSRNGAGGRARQNLFNDILGGRLPKDDGSLTDHFGTHVQGFLGLLSARDKKTYIVDQIIIEADQHGRWRNPFRPIIFKIKIREPDINGGVN